MAKPLKNVAVVLAGGVGARVGLDLPKQLIKIAGRPIIDHTLAILDRHPAIDEIIIMMAPGHLDVVRELIRRGGYDKVSAILEGGETRNATTVRALDHLGDVECNILFHDAVRPLLSPRIVSDCVRALDTYSAVDVAIPSADTIIEVSPANTIRAIPPRANLRRGQTPQGFRASVIKAAYRRAAQDPDFQATDDCTVVVRYLPDVPVWVVDGDERNMKVTEPIDVYIADKLFQLTDPVAPATCATDDDYRRALRGKTLVVFGGSYGIGADIATFARQHGANVACFSRSTTKTHIERREDVVAAARSVLDRFGRVDFVANTAGVLPTGTLVETSDETIYSATEINYIAPMIIAQEFFPLLRRTRGSLLLFTSSSYTRGRSGYSLYSSAKAATVNLTQALADEWASASVRVNCLNPERTGTPMRTRAFGNEPSDTLLDSMTVARAAVDVLLSDGTGHILDLRRDDPLASPSEDSDASADVAALRASG